MSYMQYAGARVLKWDIRNYGVAAKPTNRQIQNNGLFHICAILFTRELKIDWKSTSFCEGAFEPEVSHTQSIIVNSWAAN